eukprot:2509581-Pleurochrysis_carterae.AAC.2
MDLKSLNPPQGCNEPVRDRDKGACKVPCDRRLAAVEYVAWHLLLTIPSNFDSYVSSKLLSSSEEDIMELHPLPPRRTPVTRSLRSRMPRQHTWWRTSSRMRAARACGPS